MKRFLILLLLTCLALCACSREDSKKRAERSAAPVRTAVVTPRDVPMTIDGVGYVSASLSVAVRSRIMGELMDVRFKEGDDVTQGQVLFVLDQRPFKAALQEAEARLERDRAQLTKAGDDMRRFQRLASQGYTSQEQYQQSQTDAAALRATVLADEAAVKQAALQLEYCTISAPIKGRAGVVMQNFGNLIKANADEPMLTIDCLEPVYVYFSVPEAHLPAIRQRAGNGQLRVQVTPQGGTSVLGTLTFIDNNVDMRTGTIRLRAEVPNADRALWPGQFVSARLILGERAQALTVPAATVLNGPTGAYVYIVDAENKAQHRLVTVGSEYEQLLIIEKGLEAGERVVTEGQVRLAPDVFVHSVDKP